MACECSGRVRDAFRRLGHDAYSCDILPSATEGPHFQEDVLGVINRERWDLMIAHPPCTYLTLAGIRWLYHPDDSELPASHRRRHPSYPDRMKQLEEACTFFNALNNCGIPKIAVENSQPSGVAMRMVGRYTQKVQPWMFGEGFTKGACLWLKNLPPLVPTNIVEGREAACHNASPGPDRGHRRSVTYAGIAEAMATQWGGIGG